MNIVLAGAGVEDSRSPAWGHVFRSLQELGHSVFAFDPIDAERLRITKTVDDQWQWVLDANSPDLVIVLPLGDERDEQMLSRIQERSLNVRVLIIPELASPHCTIENAPTIKTKANCNLSLAEKLPLVRPAQNCDVVVLGNGSSGQAQLVSALNGVGLNVRLYGNNWEDVPGCAPLARSPISITYLSSLLATAKTALVLDGSIKGPCGRESGPLHSAFSAVMAKVPLIYLASGSDDQDKDAPVASNVLEYFEDQREVRAAPGIEEAVDYILELINDPQAAQEQIDAALDKLKNEHVWQVEWSKILAEFDREPTFKVTKDGPLVTFITTAYNVAPYIGTTIESMLNQSQDDIEILVMNDGSTDNTPSVVKNYLSDTRVKLFEQPNSAQTGRFDWVLRRTVENARGEFIAILDGDDYAFPSRIEEQLRVFDEDPKADLVHTGGISIDENGLQGNLLFELTESYDTSSLLRRQIFCNTVANPTVMMKRRVIDNIGSFWGGFATDYDLWFKACRTVRFRYLPKCLVGYRMHQTNASVGAGYSKGYAQGQMTRMEERSRSNIVDLYPALAYANLISDIDAWVAAYVDVGNGHLRYMPDGNAALREYDRAMEIGGPRFPEVHVCRAIALFALDHKQAANNELIAARDLGLDVSKFISPDGSITNFPNAREISHKAFQLPIEVARETHTWDGTPASRTRILLIPDWKNLEVAWPYMAEYFNVFSPEEDVDLVLATFGTDSQDALDSLSQVLPRDLDLEQVAPLTLEMWDTPHYLPMDRFALVIDLRGKAVDDDDIKQAINAMGKVANRVHPAPF